MSILSNNLLSISFPSVSATRCFYNPLPARKSRICFSQLSETYQRYLAWNSNALCLTTRSSLVALAANGTGPSKGDHRALETVLRLYEAIKNRSMSELSDIIGEECLCICNFVSSLQPFYGKKQVTELFTSLMGNLGNNIEFVVQPTLNDGMTVGVSWRLECSTTHVLLGTGFSIFICHVYEGRVLIRNVEMFMEPFLHIEPLRLKMVGFAINFIGNLASREHFKGDHRRRNTYILCSLVFLAALFFFLVLFKEI